MPKITKHLPNFMEGFETPTKAFSTLEELENISFVKTWRSWAEFDRFEVFGPDSAQPLLSAHFNNGKHWIVGYLTPDAKYVLKALNTKDYNHATQERTLTGRGAVSHRHGG